MTDVEDPPQRRPGQRVLMDPAAASADPKLPAFLARPADAPVYHGFPIIEETLTDGWRFGAISAFDDDPDGCVYGDGFVVAPDGSRAGIVWEVGEFATQTISAPEPGRWGVYGIAFPRAVRGVQDLVECFRAILPELRAIHARVVDARG